jgi:tetratricopeptide (TPR) repeat protein
MRNGTKPTEVAPRSGRLDVVPVPNLLYRLHRARTTGTLALAHRAVQHSVGISEGMLVSVSLGGDAVEFLGRILLELGKIDDATYQSSLVKLAQTKRLHGQVLREMGAITEADLTHALAVQARRKLSRLFYLDGGTFDFTSQASAPTTAPIHPLPIIRNGIRTAYDDERIQRLLAPLSGLEVRLRHDFASREGEFEFDEDDRKMLKHLRQYVASSDFADGKVFPTLGPRRLLATLLLTESLDIRDEGSAWKEPRKRVFVERPPPPPADAGTARGVPRTPTPPKIHRPPEAAPRPSRSSGDPGKRSAPGVPLRKATPTPPRPREDPAVLLAEKERQIENTDFFGILGVSREAGASELKEAYFAQAKKFHPDRFVSGELRAMRRRAEAVFERVSEAYDTLRSEERRAEYLALLADERLKGDRRRAQMANQADGQFRRAEELLQQGDFAGAEVYLRRATELFPGDAAFHAALGWATYQNAQNSKVRRFSGAIKHLLKALELEPRSEAAHLSLGRIYEAEGQKEEAVRHYEQVLHVNPSHSEAQGAVERLRAPAAR